MLSRLHQIAGKKILFGQQDALAYGVGWRNELHPWRSDVEDVCGQAPAVFGWDLGRLGTPANLDGVPFHRMQEWMRTVHQRGGMNTVSWHMDNPVTGGDSWDVRGRPVAAILPGGPAHDWLLRKLDLFAEFCAGINNLPLVFRPFHEHTGAWFWWGEGHRSDAEYIDLWRFTHDYLRENLGLRNLIWAYSPDRFRDQAHYLACYPGDRYVDVLGLDEYHHLSAWWKQTEFIRRLRDIVTLAEERGKIAALTETGLEMIPRADWWTRRLLEPILADPVARRIAWMLVWRNDNPRHHFGPYPGHRTADDFRRFSRHPAVGFLGDMQQLI